MARLSEDEYLVELNRFLEKEPYFEPGMRFIAWPAGARGASVTGYAWEGGMHMPAVFASAATKCGKEHIIVVTQHGPKS